MSFIQQELYKYASKPILGFLGIYFYNVFIENRTYWDMVNIYDGSVMAASVLTSKLWKDLICQLLNIENEIIQCKLIEPLVNAFVYNYGYNTFVHKKFSYKLNPRSEMKNYFIGSIGSVLLSFVENPVVSLVSGVKSY